MNTTRGLTSFIQRAMHHPSMWTRLLTGADPRARECVVHAADANKIPSFARPTTFFGGVRQASPRWCLHPGLFASCAPIATGSWFTANPTASSPLTAFNPSPHPPAPQNRSATNSPGNSPPSPDAASRSAAVSSHRSSRG